MTKHIWASNPTRSLIDTDFYKLTMMQAVLHNYPNAEVVWEFRCRSDEDLTPYIPLLEEEFSKFKNLCLTNEQIKFLHSIDFMEDDFVRFLSLFRFDLSYCKIKSENGQLKITLKGPWLHVILFEVPILATISEVRNRVLYKDNVNLEQAQDKLRLDFENLKKEATFEELQGFKLADYGTRRRFSYHSHKQAVELLIREFPGKFVGTSNVHLAHKFHLKPLGTMAHEWIMAHQQLGPRLIDSQKVALEKWVQEYRGHLGIALTDCINMDAFLNDFDLYFAKLFDGLRHDSGDPLVWARKAINHYEKLGINPKTKTLIFSDGLDFMKALEIYRALNKEVGISFGIGTKITNNVPNTNPLNIVIKMTHCNGQPVAKISDEPNKTQGGDASFIQYLKHVFKV